MMIQMRPSAFVSQQLNKSRFTAVDNVTVTYKKGDQVTIASNASTTYGVYAGLMFPVGRGIRGGASYEFSAVGEVSLGTGALGQKRAGIRVMDNPITKAHSTIWGMTTGAVIYEQLFSPAAAAESVASNGSAIKRAFYLYRTSAPLAGGKWSATSGRSWTAFATTDNAAFTPATAFLGLIVSTPATKDIKCTFSNVQFFLAK